MSNVCSLYYRLCIIFVLGVFLWSQYSTIPAEIAIVSHERLVVTERRIIKGSNSSQLQSDYLVPSSTHQTDTPFTERDVSSRNILPIILPNILGKEVSNRTVTRHIISAKCDKKFDVSFLKVHKAGSTTVMNIFLRFAIEHDLNIVLPNKPDGFGFNYLGYGKTVSKDRIVPLPENETYNILCNHVVYNKQAFRSIMPPDTVYVGIIREPASHFVSAASYYGFYKNLLSVIGEDGITSPVSKYLQNPAQFRVNKFFVNNRMSFDFGIPSNEFLNAQYVSDYINEIDEDYGLVMIMERFSESLVLLKRLLCWSTKDILYVPLNAQKNGPAFELTDSDHQLLREYNSADFRLYDHFKVKFDATIESLGEDFISEVKSFKRVQESVSRFCLQIDDVTGNSEPVMKVPESAWGEAFFVTVHDCQLMTESELPMMQRLIIGAWEKYNSSRGKS